VPNTQQVGLFAWSFTSVQRTESVKWIFGKVDSAAGCAFIWRQELKKRRTDSSFFINEHYSLEN
jgi:hypothetical protein